MAGKIINISAVNDNLKAVCEAAGVTDEARMLEIANKQFENLPAATRDSFSTEEEAINAVLNAVAAYITTMGGNGDAKVPSTQKLAAGSSLKITESDRSVAKANAKDIYNKGLAAQKSTFITKVYFKKPNTYDRLLEKSPDAPSGNQMVIEATSKYKDKLAKLEASVTPESMEDFKAMQKIADALTTSNQTIEYNAPSENARPSVAGYGLSRDGKEETYVWVNGIAAAYMLASEFAAALFKQPNSDNPLAMEVTERTNREKTETTYGTRVFGLKDIVSAKPSGALWTNYAMYITQATDEYEDINLRSKLSFSYNDTVVDSKSQKVTVTRKYRLTGKVSVKKYELKPEFNGIFTLGTFGVQATEPKQLSDSASIALIEQVTATAIAASREGTKSKFSGGDAAAKLADMLSTGSGSKAPAQDL